jgi:addiction module HigA family antidote
LIMPRPPIHPGEVLAEELAETAVTPTELARQLKVPANRITQIIQGKRAISGDTALRLGHWFGTSAQFWLNLQSAYDIRMAARQAGAQIARLRVRSSRARAAAGRRSPLWMAGMITATTPDALAQTARLRFPDLPAVRQRGRLTSKRMLRVDPWEKAADCERALRLTLDPVHRANLTNIREFWISLANERPFLSEHEFARQAEAIGRLHASLAAPASIH